MSTTITDCVCVCGVSISSDQKMCEDCYYLKINGPPIEVPSPFDYEDFSETKNCACGSLIDAKFKSCSKCYVRDYYVVPELFIPPISKKGIGWQVDFKSCEDEFSRVDDSRSIFIQEKVIKRLPGQKVSSSFRRKVVEPVFHNEPLPIVNEPLPILTTPLWYVNQLEEERVWNCHRLKTTKNRKLDMLNTNIPYDFKRCIEVDTFWIKCEGLDEPYDDFDHLGDFSVPLIHKYCPYDMRKVLIVNPSIRERFFSCRTYYPIPDATSYDSYIDIPHSHSRFSFRKFKSKDLFNFKTDYIFVYVTRKVSQTGFHHHDVTFVPEFSSSVFGVDRRIHSILDSDWRLYYIPYYYLRFNWFFSKLDIRIGGDVMWLQVLVLIGLYVRKDEVHLLPYSFVESIATESVGLVWDTEHVSIMRNFAKAMESKLINYPNLIQLNGKSYLTPSRSELICFSCSAAMIQSVKLNHRSWMYLLVPLFTSTQRFFYNLIIDLWKIKTYLFSLFALLFIFFVLILVYIFEKGHQTSPIAVMVKGLLASNSTHDEL